jgi:hypothetical protein
MMILAFSARADCSVCKATTLIVSSTGCGNMVWNLYVTTTTDGTDSAGTAGGIGACIGGYVGCDGNYVSPASVPATIQPSASGDDSTGECTGYFYVTSYESPSRSSCPPGSSYPNGTKEDLPPASSRSLAETYVATC